MKPRPPRPDPIDPACLVDDHVLRAHIEGLVRAAPQRAAEEQTIRQREADLQRLVGKRGWRSYLRLAQAIAARHAAAEVYVGRELVWAGYLLGLRRAGRPRT